MTTLGSLICFLVLTSSFRITGHCDPSSSPGKHVALFFFGDSFFDAGNNNYISTTTNNQANFLPYGETFFKYPTGRFSDGRIVPDFIAEHAKLPLIPTFLPSTHHEFTYGVNFASGGAGALAETYQGLVIGLKTQLSHFKIVWEQLKQKLGDAAAKTLVSNAVYLFNIGTNDYFATLTTDSSEILLDYSKETICGYGDRQPNDYSQSKLRTYACGEIYMKGGRKFGFVNLGPLGCFPALKALMPGFSGSCLEDGLELSKLHNKALSKILQELESQLKDFAYANHDLYNSLTERINNPSKYGFEEAMACCGSGPFRGLSSCGGKRGITKYELCNNPDEYLFFDYVHPSEKANKQIAELMWSGTADVTRPYDLKALIELN